MVEASGVGKTGRLGGRLLGLVFIAVAIGFLLFGILPNLHDWIRMRGWEPVVAELIASDLETHHGDDSTTYKVVGTYRYRYDGREHIGRRIGISDGGSDNVGDWHQQSYRALQRSPLQVWVNPSDPAEAVFDRELRWGLLGFKLIFVVVFGVMGVGIYWMLGRRPIEAPPGMPLWQWDPRWRENRIRSDTRGEMGVLWGLAVVWNAITAPALFAIPGELAQGNYPILLVLLFAAVGLGMIYLAIRKTMEWRRFGVTELRLDPFPGSIGGDVGGTLELALPADGACRFSAELCCRRIYSYRCGGETETRHSVLWQDAQALRPEPGMHGTRLRFRFEVPAGLPSSESASASYHQWHVRLSGDLPGVDLDRSFEIPVFAQERPVRSRLKIERETAPPPVEIQAAVVRLRPLADGLELYYPPFRSAGIAIALLLFGLLFAAPGGYFLFAGAPDGLPAFMAAIFFGIGLLVCLIGLYKLGNSLRVQVTPQGVRRLRRVWGLPLETLLPVAQIRAVEKQTGWQWQVGTRTRVDYMIRALKQDGGSLILGDSLPDVGTAEQVIARIRQSLALPDAAPAGADARIRPDSIGGQMGEPGRRVVRYAALLANLVALAVFLYFLWDFGLLAQVQQLLD